MSIFSDNLRYLREKRNDSQQQTAGYLGIKRGKYEPYESGKAEPTLEMLVRISRHYGLSIDLLLSVDIRKYSIDEMLRLDDNRIVLPIKVDGNGRNLIELVPYKARAGYLTGYSDPEYIESLQQISLPFLGTGKYRAFPIAGDSMPPHDERSFIIGRYIENLGEIKSRKTYILVTMGEGIIYKRLGSRNPDSLTVLSDNLAYHPYDIRLSEILEIWEYVAHIGGNDSFQVFDEDDTKALLQTMMLELQGIRKEIGKA